MKITSALTISVVLSAAQAEPPKPAFRVGGIALRAESTVPAAVTAPRFTLLITPTIVTGAAQAPLTPGLYAAAPYTMRVEVPQPVDEAMVIAPSSQLRGTARIIEPQITLVPVQR